ncbi:MAG TPA: hypothetical protein VNA16_06385 [Abditibacteriaceae bacterium]|nr:hypothetical protein [Abditibacteriaceae bacterium]
MKPSPKFPARSTLILWVALGVLCLELGLAPAHATRRPGAPRLIRFNWSDNAPGSLQGAGFAPNASIYRGAFGVRQAREGAAGWSLYFTREVNGARNLWRAVPEENPAQPASDPSEDVAEGTRSGEPRESLRESLIRNVVWRAMPLTHLAAGFFADQAAPTPDGRALLCVTNADSLNAAGSNASALNAGDPARSHIARLDLDSGSLTPLTENTARNHSPAVAPGGQRFAFVSERDGAAAIYVMSLEGGTAWCVAALAQHPCWLDDNTLLFESTRPDQAGLYRITLPEKSATNIGGPELRRFFTRHGEAASSPDGRVLAVASRIITGAPGTAPPRGAVTVESKLSVLAADGSGERIVPGTEGARAPHFAPDGSAIIFDAPAARLEENSTNPVTTRALWLLPMLRVPPTATLLGIRPARAAKLVNDGKVTEVEILNNAGKVTTVEILGKATALEVLGTIFAEDIAAPDVKLEFGRGNEPVQWHPMRAPRGPVHEGVLTHFIIPAGVTGEWTLRLTVTDASGDTSQSTLTLVLPLALPKQPHPNAPILAATLPNAVAPVVPPRPAAPVALPNPQSIPGLPSGQAGPAPSPPRGGVQAVRTSPAIGTASLAGTPRRTATARPAKQPASKPTSRPTSRPGADAGRLRVRGTPAIMTVGESLPVTATLINTGRQTWASHGSTPVRLIYCWITAGSGSRVRWALTWLRQPVPRGGSTRLAFDLTAPARPGRYRLTYSLVRLNGTDYEPPPFKTRQDRWPGEFGSITYAVVVNEH